MSPPTPLCSLSCIIMYTFILLTVLLKIPHQFLHHLFVPHPFLVCLFILCPFVFPLVPHPSVFCLFILHSFPHLFVFHSFVSPSICFLAICLPTCLFFFHLFPHVSYLFFLIWFLAVCFQSLCPLLFPCLFVFPCTVFVSCLLVPFYLFPNLLFQICFPSIFFYRFSSICFLSVCFPVFLFPVCFLSICLPILFVHRERLTVPDSSTWTNRTDIST